MNLRAIASTLGAHAPSVLAIGSTINFHNKESQQYWQARRLRSQEQCFFLLADFAMAMGGS